MPLVFEPAPIFTDAERRSCAAQVADALRAAVATPFAMAGSCRHDVRRHLINAGHGWEAADLEAQRIVAEALEMIGVTLPEDVEPKVRAPRGPRATAAELMHDCEQCGVRFQRRRLAQRYCNLKCVGAARKAAPPINLARFVPCEACGTTFKRPNSTQRFCSIACRDRARRNASRAPVEENPVTASANLIVAPPISIRHQASGSDHPANLQLLHNASRVMSAPIFPSRTTRPAILTGQALEAAMLRVIDVLRTSTASIFEHEATCRHALRVAFILKGRGWAQSDRQAADIIEAAFRRMGIERPTWEMGQPQATTPPENCYWCEEPIPAKMRDALRRARFCSPDCAKKAIAARDYKHRRDYEVVSASAFRIAYAAALAPRACKQCGATFFPPSRGSKQAHCSKACSDIAQQVYASITCVQCGVTCRPAKPGSRFCSQECFYTHGHEPRHESQCVFCAKSFRSKRPGALYCSATCSARHYQYRSGRVVPTRFTPPAFDYFIARAA